MKWIDLSGKTFNRLTAHWPVGRGTTGARSGTVKHPEIQWLCTCSCGSMAIVIAGHLRHNKAKSCGCLQREGAAQRARAKPLRLRHGHAYFGRVTPVYQTWVGMIQRCTNQRGPGWKYYGGRGIKVCDRWLSSFENFLADMGEKPEGLSLDRINNDGNYEPSNCRWATRSEQQKNRRPMGREQRQRLSERMKSIWKAARSAA